MENEANLQVCQHQTAYVPRACASISFTLLSTALVRMGLVRVMR